MTDRVSELEQKESNQEGDNIDYSKLSETAIKDILANTDDNNNLDLSKVTDDTLDQIEAAFIRPLAKE